MSGKSHRGGTSLNPNANPFQVAMTSPSGGGTGSGNSYMDPNNQDNFHMMNHMDVSGGYGMGPQYDGGGYHRGGRYHPSYPTPAPMQQGYHANYGPPHPNDGPYTPSASVGRPPMVGPHRHGGMGMGGMGLGMGGVMERAGGGGAAMGPGGGFPPLGPPPPQSGLGGYGAYRGGMGVPPGAGFGPDPLRHNTPSPTGGGLAPAHPSQSPRPPPSSPQAPPGAAARVKETPKVILVAGFRRTGKTTIARELARGKLYEYISLRGAAPEDGEDADDSEALDLMHSSRFAPLNQVLEQKKSIKGIVIDDALIRSKYEPYHVNHLLEKAGLHIDILVIITNELSDLLKRDVSFDSAAQKQAHPESFEFGEKLEEANTNEKGAPIVVVDGTESLEVIVSETMKQVAEMEARGLPPLRLPKVEFVPKCTLVTDPHLAELVFAAETTALELETLPYGFPYSEPNFLLGYIEFVRNALLLKNYLVTPWIWGNKVSLIGYDNEVYIHLPSYKILFLMQDVPVALQELMVQAKRELSQKEEKSQEKETLPENACLFSLEAVMQDDIIYISDMLLLGKHLGSKMLLADRIAMLKESLEKLPPDGNMQLLEYYPVNEISQCMDKYTDVARGILFVNPDGIATGYYESRNFIYPSENKKTVKIRIWGGHLEESGMWCFDAYARNDEGEFLVTNADNVQIPVYISDAQVGEYTINDGNIIECVLEQKPPSPIPKGGKKGNKLQTTSYFVFQKRCNWQVEPTTLYYQSALVRKPAWTTSSFLETCAMIPYKPASLTIPT